MKVKLKKLFPLLILAMSMLIFTSCASDSSNNDESNNSNDDIKEETMMNNTALNSTSNIMLLSSDNENDLQASYDLIIKLNTDFISKGGYVYKGSASTENDKEIIFGYVPQREVSIKAHKILSEMKSNSEIRESRFVVYAENGKIAFAHDDNKHIGIQTISVVLERFLDEYINGKDEVVFENGIVMSGTIDLYEEQKALDDIENEERWNKVESVIGDKDIYLAFRGFFEECFNDEITELVAKLYDPATGLFYSSLSGKNAEGIYPNPEATGMVLGYVMNTGMLRNVGARYYIPDIAKYKIIYYLKSIQAEDGEFYISQMKKSEIDSNRLGRDRSACTGLLDRLGASPTYSVGSMVGDGVDAEEYWRGLVRDGLVREEDKPHIYYADDDRTAYKGSFRESKTEAVSKVVSASSTSQFQSHEAFIKWLLEKDPYNNPYASMSNTSSAASLIADWSKKLGEYEGNDTVIEHRGKTFDLLKGDTLNGILIRWINSHINAAGLFGKITNEYDENGQPVYDGFFGGWGYQNSNGFLKAIGRYNTMQIPYPEPRLAAESLLLGINSDEPLSSNILVIFNVWSSLNNLRNNIKSFYDGADKDELLTLIDNGLKRQIVIDETTGATKAYGAVAIEKCTKKILAFKKSDGGFGHVVAHGSKTWQGGLLVGITSDNLSDIDAIVCSTTYLGNAMSVLFGLSFVADVPMGTDSDLLLFIETMLRQEHVVKEMQ